MDASPPMLHRQISEPRVSQLMHKRGLSKVQEVVDVQQYNALSLGANETASLLLDKEGNLRDELGFLVEKEEEAMDLATAIANTTPLDRRPTNSVLVPKASGGLEAQRKAWEDFQAQVGGTINALTRPELQRWRKNALPSPPIIGNVFRPTNSAQSSSSNLGEFDMGFSPPVLLQAAPKMTEPQNTSATQTKKRTFGFSRLRSALKRNKDEENTSPTTIHKDSVSSNSPQRLSSNRSEEVSSPLTFTPNPPSPTLTSRIALRSASFMLRQPTKVRGKHLTTLIRTFGIPTELRGQVWVACTGASEKRLRSDMENQYENLLEKALTTPTESSNQIELDLRRTFPTNYLFQQDEGITSLRHVLLAYSLRNPEVGYCQSMNFIVATLLLHMDEGDAFWVLSAIVEDLLPGYFSKNLIGVHVDQRTFVALVNARFPKIAAHLENLQLPLAVVAYQWFMCLFVNALPLGATLRVWDVFLHEGPKILFRIALTAMKILHRDIMTSETFQEAYIVLSEGTKDRERFTGPRLLRLAFDPLSFGRFPSKTLTNLREMQMASVRREIEESLAAAAARTPSLRKFNVAPPLVTQEEYENESEDAELVQAERRFHTERDVLTLGSDARIASKPGLSVAAAAPSPETISPKSGERASTPSTNDSANCASPPVARSSTPRPRRMSLVKMSEESIIPPITPTTFTWGFSPTPLNPLENAVVGRDLYFRPRASTLKPRRGSADERLSTDSQRARSSSLDLNTSSDPIVDKEKSVYSPQRQSSGRSSSSFSPPSNLRIETTPRAFATKTLDDIHTGGAHEPQLEDDNASVVSVVSNNESMLSIDESPRKSANDGDESTIWDSDEDAYANSVMRLNASQNNMEKSDNSSFLRSGKKRSQSAISEPEEMVQKKLSSIKELEDSKKSFRKFQSPGSLKDEKNSSLFRQDTNTDDGEEDRDCDEKIPTVELPAEYSTRLRALSYVMSARQTGSAVAVAQHLALVPEDELNDLQGMLHEFQGDDAEVDAPFSRDQTNSFADGSTRLEVPLVKVLSATLMAKTPSDAKPLDDDDDVDLVRIGEKVGRPPVTAKSRFSFVNPFRLFASCAPTH